MNTVESGHFLLTAINSAEDVSLFLDAYNACTADDVLRGNAVLDNRPLMILGSDKRIGMCKKKLPVRMQEAGLTFDATRVTYVTNDSMKEFVVQTLDSLKGGVKPEEVVKTIQHHQEEERVVIRQLENHNPVTPELPQAKELPLPVPSEVEEPPVEEEQLEPTPRVDQQFSGMCQYGVPKFEVQYLTPNVIGLKESLYVNVEEEDLKKFFESVKTRVLGSIKNDR